VPRTREEGQQLAERYAHLANKIIIQKQAVNGLDLIWRADLVISGGGTMTREAAVMGVPAYTIFASRLGAIDRYLADTGRLHLIRTSNQVEQIQFNKRARTPFIPPSPKVLDFFLNVLEKELRAGQR
jgi:predicted glycosyltransferase